MKSSSSVNVKLVTTMNQFSESVSDVDGLHTHARSVNGQAQSFEGTAQDCALCAQGGIFDSMVKAIVGGAKSVPRLLPPRKRTSPTRGT